MKGRTRVVLAGLATAVGLAAQLSLAVGGDPARGKAIYERNCQVCHGPQGKGDGPAGEALTPPAADLTAPATANKSDAQLLETIQDGKPGTAMASWKAALKDRGIRDVLAYVRTLGN